MNRDVFLSILAMDSYQRGYAVGINGVDKDSNGDPVTRIGTANILQDSTQYAVTANGDTVGFYAAAYNWNGTTVISYRGTDFDKGKELLHDVLYGWSSFTGLGTNSQFAFAEQFFNAVMNIPTGHSAFEIGGVGPVFNNVIVTGHSLGGALAGANDNTAARCAAA